MTSRKVRKYVWDHLPSTLTLQNPPEIFKRKRILQQKAILQSGHTSLLLLFYRCDYPPLPLPLFVVWPRSVSSKHTDSALIIHLSRFHLAHSKNAFSGTHMCDEVTSSARDDTRVNMRWHSPPVTAGLYGGGWISECWEVKEELTLNSEWQAHCFTVHLKVFSLSPCFLHRPLFSLC